MAVIQRVSQSWYQRPPKQRGWHVQKYGVMKRKLRLRNTDHCDVCALVRFSFQPEGKEAKDVYIWRWDRVRFLYICSPLYIWMCLLLTSVTVLFEELSGGYKYLLAPLLCPSHVLRHSKVCKRSVSEVS